VGHDDVADRISEDRDQDRSERVQFFLLSNGMNRCINYMTNIEYVNLCAFAPKGGAICACDEFGF
jgi:hypothetical protein